MSTLSPEGLVQFLSSKNLGSGVVDNFKENGISGEAFLLMDEDHLKEVAPRLLDRIYLKEIQMSELSKNVCSYSPALKSY